MSPADATELARRIEASLFAIRQGMRDLMASVEIVLRAIAVPAEPDMGIPISPPSPLPTPITAPISGGRHRGDRLPTWSSDRVDTAVSLEDAKTPRHRIVARLNELPGPPITGGMLGQFFRNRARAALAEAGPKADAISIVPASDAPDHMPPACEISPEPPEPAVTAAPEPCEISPAAPQPQDRPTALNIYAGMAERQAVEAARCPMTWDGVVEWGKSNRVPLQGHARQFLAAVNAKRAEFGLPAFQLVKPRGPHEVMPALVVSKDGEARA